jgi:hypothetical protein
MIGNIQLRPTPPPNRWMQSAPLLQRILVIGILTVALLISGALIYFQPGSHTFARLEAPLAAPASQAAPVLPPGAETYYYWGQHRPMAQQP